mmetsp:Transcript_55275/g.98373  ORF Transcript_55275/g.98373 Transcript_55275/m.98373 type:complete len:291 (+) Transcript_55275:415-1287(+)
MIKLKTEASIHSGALLSFKVHSTAGGTDARAPIYGDTDARGVRDRSFVEVGYARESTSFGTVGVVHAYIFISIKCASSSRCHSGGLRSANDATCVRVIVTYAFINMVFVDSCSSCNPGGLRSANDATCVWVVVTYAFVNMVFANSVRGSIVNTIGPSGSDAYVDVAYMRSMALSLLNFSLLFLIKLSLISRVKHPHLRPCRIEAKLLFGVNARSVNGNAFILLVFRFDPICEKSPIIHSITANLSTLDNITTISIPMSFFVPHIISIFEHALYRCVILHTTHRTGRWHDC